VLSMNYANCRSDDDCLISVVERLVHRSVLQEPVVSSSFLINPVWNDPGNAGKEMVLERIR
jgi:hypothetical protein